VSGSRLESLKLAARTPETRVSLDDPAGTPRTLLREISWTGGFLDGVTIPLAGDLTALIGGRGTGKSTVIESLRYVLDLAPLGGEAAKDHEAIVKNVLGSGAIVKVKVDTVSPTPRSFTIERTVADPPVVRDSAGTATNLRPVDVAGPVEVFGQHELAELASNSTHVADMIRRFAGSTGTSSAHQAVVDKLATNREQLGKVEKAIADLEEELAGIPRLEEQVDQFKQTDVATRLADLKRLQQGEAVFTEAKERVDSVASLVADLADPDVEAALIAVYDGLDDSPQKDKLQKAAAATATLAAALKSLVADARNAITSAEVEISTAKTSWDTATKPQRDGHGEVLRKLHDDGLEPDKYLQTSKALEDLNGKKPRLKTLSDRLKELTDERTKLLGELTGHESEQLKALHAAVKQANDSAGGVVVVKPIAAPDRAHIVEAITKHVPGQRTQITAAINDENFSPRSFVAAVRGGASELAKLGIKGAQAANLIDAREPLLRELEELAVGHAVDVLLRVDAGGGQSLKTMDELSKGQRATALLLLLLGASTAPLVIDQPEDDLDNSFVYEGVVKHLRQPKGVRQIIASTHNANVPVLGDAELIVALEGDGRHGRPATDGVGSLDDATIRSMAETLLEGGPAAFNARQHLYGF
jgi:ABC-type cobalamin/Fe3+-siderophores transport system ATPase subunit